ncbi:RICIN domain-containing protein [Pedobacter sp.]|uniref:RICIN domain-containing protein n=1 Tax=Pedobacter sp. TaxID=1411316 RepID=UPI0031D577E7
MKNQMLFLKFASVILLTALCMTSCKKIAEVNSKEEETFNSAITKRKIQAIQAIEIPQTLANGTFYIMSRTSSKVIDVPGGQNGNNTSVWQWGGTGGTNQQWKLTALAGGYYSIIGVESNRALTAADNTDGGNIQINDYTGANNQQWQFVALGSNYYRIVNRASGKVLDLWGSSLDDGGDINQYSSHGGENQQWVLVKIKYNGQVGWTWTSTNGVPADVITRITNAMNDACARYNAGADWAPRTLNVSYNTGVPTAEANVNGDIRFGGNTSYQNVRTAMHEMGHCYGVGQTGGWYDLTNGGTYTGANGIATIRALETPTSNISAGGGHFWPYGLNYDSEWSETNAFRHVKVVRAMDLDGVY